MIGQFYFIIFCFFNFSLARIGLRYFAADISSSVAVFYDVFKFYGTLFLQIGMNGNLAINSKETLWKLERQQLYHVCSVNGSVRVGTLSHLIAILHHYITYKLRILK